MKKLLSSILLISVLFFSLSSCKKEEVEPDPSLSEIFGVYNVLYMEDSTYPKIEDKNLITLDFIIGQSQSFTGSYMQLEVIVYKNGINTYKAVMIDGIKFRKKYDYVWTISNDKYGDMGTWDRKNKRIDFLFLNKYSNQYEKYGAVKK